MEFAEAVLGEHWPSARTVKSPGAVAALAARLYVGASGERQKKSSWLLRELFQVPEL